MSVWYCSADIGDTTSVRPGSNTSGNCKPSDLPDPVGITASTSRLDGRAHQRRLAGAERRVPEVPLQRLVHIDHA